MIDANGVRASDPSQAGTNKRTSRAGCLSAGWSQWPWFVLLGLLLVPVFALRPIPIDETRYLTVAWNMVSGGHWLVPWRDGSAYPDKPPLLFWLINLGWWIAGVHVWSARLVELVMALTTLPLLARLARDLGARREAGITAAAVWVATAAFSGYAGAIMFDLLLTVCALLAWLGAVQLAQNRWWRGMLLLALGLGAGILAKGPVSLLVGALPAALAPWWWPPVRERAGRHYLGLLAALLLGVALALAWALPAAHFGGHAYADAIFLGQTVDRVADSFAHARPVRWYLPILPVLLLPWPLVLGQRDRAGEHGRYGDDKRLDRFALAAFVPPFVVFCLISGKQPHYLLPLLPVVALMIGARLDARRWRIVRWRLGAMLTAVALGLGAALHELHARGDLTAAYAWISALLLLGLVLLLWRRAPAMRVIHVAVAMAAMTTLAKLAFAQALSPRYDVKAVSMKLAAAQRAGVPLLHAGMQEGLFGFAGRMTEAIPTALSRAAVSSWGHAHPHGWVISNDLRYEYTAAPIYRQPFLGRSLSIWRSADITTRGAPAPWPVQQGTGQARNAH